MVDVKTSGDHPASMAERITNRLRNSGGDSADVTVQKGTGPTRTFTNIHNSRNAAHGSGGPEKPDGRGIDERGRR